MLIVLFVAFLVIAFVAILLKRRHERGRDQIRGGFNAGITERSPAVDGSGTHVNRTSLAPASSGRNSPARTRDAFMPYGYGYTRSESRPNSGSGAMVDVHPQLRPFGSPLARGEMSASEMEREAGLGAAREMQGKRIRVREQPFDHYGREKEYR